MENCPNKISITSAFLLVAVRSIKSTSTTLQILVTNQKQTVKPVFPAINKTTIKKKIRRVDKRISLDLKAFTLLQVSLTTVTSDRLVQCGCVSTG